MTRLDLGRIGATLARLGSAIDGDAAQAADVRRRMLAGYGAVDAMLGDGADPFRYGASHLLLELNHLVLCGPSPERRAQFAEHLRATERRFYGTADGGATEFFDGMARQASRAPQRLAAAAFVAVVSAPQLFIEGNRRTACLIASFLLARGGAPPFVVTPEGWPRYRSVADRCAAIERGGIWGRLVAHRAAVAVERLAVELSDPADTLRPVPAAPH